MQSSAIEVAPHPALHSQCFVVPGPSVTRKLVNELDAQGSGVFDVAAFWRGRS